MPIITDIFQALTAAFDVMKKEHQNIEFLLYQLVNLYEEGVKKTMSTRRGEYFSLNDLREDLGPDVIKFFLLEKIGSSNGF